MAEQWATSSNTALKLNSIGSSHLRDAASFHPTFTYPIFGEAETIYGYAKPQINVSFRSDSLVYAVDFSYDAKLESKTAKIDDPVGALSEFLPEHDVVKDTTELQALHSTRYPTAFTPLGQKVHTYTREPPSAKGKGRASDRPFAGHSAAVNGAGSGHRRTFEVYHCDWNTPGFREYHRRMQFFTLLYIEGASYIVENEHNWEFLVVYEVTSSSTTSANDDSQYHFVGYTSLYNFWFYPSWHRMRLSQFLILPPYQTQGHGSELYSHVVRLALSRENIVELTIEDPSEAFDRLRDTNDLKRLLSPEDGFLLRAKEHVKGGALRAPLDKKWSESERLRHKLAKRQWDRLVEMCMLMMLDEQDVDQINKFRLQVKSRVYGFNRDVLKQMDHHERVTKLQETFESVLDEYAQLTGVDVDTIIEVGMEEEHVNGSGPATKAPRLV